MTWMGEMCSTPSLKDKTWGKTGDCWEGGWNGCSGCREMSPTQAKLEWETYHHLV
jgi:hypothetical protein